RLANTNWFCRWFLNRKGPDVEPEFHLENAAEVNCLPNGSVRYSRKGDTIYSILQREAAALPPRTTLPATELQQSIRTLLRLHRTQAAPGVRALTTPPRRGYRIEKLQFLSEPGIYIPTWVFVPDHRGPGRTAILYVSEQGKEAEGLDFGVLEGLTAQGNVVVS